jgi:glycosyltransferase involved in cell wall biosynthesis
MSPPGSLPRVLAYADSAIWSGAEHVFTSLLADLSHGHGFSVDAAAPRENTRLWTESQRAVGDSGRVFAVRAQPSRLAGLRLLDPSRTRRVRELAAAGRYDVGVVNLPSAEYGSGGLAMPLPALGLLHVHQSLSAAGFRLGRARELVARRFVRRAARLAVVDPTAVEAAAARWGVPAEHVATLPLPAASVETMPRPAARAALGLPLDGTLVGVVGRLSVKQKGQDVLLRAVASLRDRGVDVAVVLAGNGRDAGLLRSLAAALGLSDRLHLLGNLATADAVYSAVDLVAIPSLFEGLPLVALEALAAGTPGVASDVDGLRAVWPAEWRVPPSDAQALAAALARVLAAPAEEARAAIDRARQTAAGLTGEPGASVAPLLLGLAGR